MFRDRIDAGLQLAEKLKNYRNKTAIVLAIPRGGVPVGYIVARSLNLPLDLLLSKKIGHPHNPEYAIGAVSLSDRIIIPHSEVPPDYIEAETLRLRGKLKDQWALFRGETRPLSIRGKIVIIIDDGMATGNTLRSTLPMLRRQHPQKIIVAVPVSPRAAFDKIAAEADEVVSLLIPPDFYGVGQFYEDFKQVEDDEVKKYLNAMAEDIEAGQ